MKTVFQFLVLIDVVYSFPGMRMTARTRTPGQNLHLRNLSPRGAAPYKPEYPYTGALMNGLPGSQVGGVLVPAIGDTAHAFQAPKSTDIRGPCPGMNTLANHGFISRDGITNFDEMVAGIQNAFNAEYDLAVAFAVFGIVTDGDIITERVSIGGDETSRTAPLGNPLGLFGPEKGLDNHNIFEVDASLSRNDYFLANGDDYTFNSSLFKMMTDSMATTSSPTNPIFDNLGFSKYKLMRWEQSQSQNEKFFFGPTGILLYGAATFVYSLFSSQAQSLVPYWSTMASFFGAVPSSAPYAPSTTFTSQPERFPPNWTNRLQPYGLADMFVEIIKMYSLNPVLIGGNVGPGNFDAIGDSGLITGGRLGGESGTVSEQDLACFIYQLMTSEVPTSISGVATVPIEVLNYALGKLNPVFQPFGCSLTQPS